ncbi:MAG TPA: hypothetical protein VNK04_21220 [Gemmataceae bacterium]|jgi:hypothetical protein|nr:hypothetical protein [Gemmataceae bacterium]
MLPLTFVLAWSVTVQEAQVVSLLQQLGDERYAVRAAAHAGLERILLSDYGHLYRLHVEAATHCRDLEVARRAALLLEDFYTVRPSRYPVLPWIDMLPAHCPDRQSIIDRTLGGARSLGGLGQGADWPDYRFATYLYTSELLRQGRSRRSVRQLLDEMVTLECEYREKRGMRLLAAE